MKPEPIETVWRTNVQCQACSFRALVLFADLDDADLNLIHLPITEIVYETGSTVYRAGDDATSLFTVRQGLIKLVRYLPDGTQRIVRLLRPGSTAGLEATLNQPYEHTAVALAPTTVCRIPRAVIVRLMERTPRLQGQLIERWHAALTDADEGLTGLSTGKASHRMARLLLRLIEDDGWAMLFSREDLGALLGITTEHASRTVAELRRGGAILEILGGRCHCDVARLETLAAAQ